MQEEEGKAEQPQRTVLRLSSAPLWSPRRKRTGVVWLLVFLILAVQEYVVAWKTFRLPDLLSFATSTVAPKTTKTTNEAVSASSAMIKGVFVLKVQRAEQACKTICFLNHFLYGDHHNDSSKNNTPKKYPIRIFADETVTDAAMDELQVVAGGADIQVVVNTEQWRQLPHTLTSAERDQVLAQCQDWNTSIDPLCTEMKVQLGYLYMGFWRYMHMAMEESLQDFDYFVSMDADAYFTQPVPDPFAIMAKNNLKGIFNIEAYQFETIGRGIQESAEAVFSLEERQNRYLDSPKYAFWDDSGAWHRASQNGMLPSIWGCFYGGRLDLLRSPKFRAFARHMAPYTYTYRTDEQPVIAAAWALLADNEKVWYLPKRGIHMGVYHHGWVDDSELVPTPSSSGTSTSDGGEGPLNYTLHTLDLWSRFPEHEQLLGLEEYLDILYKSADEGVAQCLASTSK